VGDDVRLRELGFRPTQALLQFVKERWVEINCFVHRAIERPDRRRRGTAAGLDALAEQDHVRRLVVLARLAELLAPDLSGEPQDLGGDLATARFLSCQRAFLALPAAPAAELAAAQ